MTHPKNSTNPLASQALLTGHVGFLNTPIDNRGIQMLAIAAGTNVEDALQTAKVLSSGLAQIHQHIHDSVNSGELVYCDGLAALGFLAETVSALVWSVQKGAEIAEVRQ